MNSSKKPLNTSGLYQPEFQKFIHYSEMFFRSEQYTNNGPCVRLLEERLANFHNVKYSVTFSSGFWALVLAIDCVKKNNDGEILLPSLTYRRLADLVSWSNLKPSFYDIKADTLTCNIESVRKKINKKTAVILGVHPIVNLFPTKDLNVLCKEYDIPFLMDSVESCYEINSDNIRVGTEAPIEVFSMHASKLLNGAEGGYITTNDKYLYEKLKLMRGFGFDSPENIGVRNGINAKLNEIHAALALASLDEIELFVEHNKTIYLRYMAKMKDVKAVKIKEFEVTGRTSYKNIVAEVKPLSKITRDQLVASLNEKNILARAYYSPPLHKKKMSYPHGSISELSVSEKIARNFILLPSGYQTSVEDVDVVCQIIKELC